MKSPESSSTKHISLSRQCYLKIAGFALGLATVATILTSASSARPSLIDHEALNDARIATAARDGLTYGYLLGRESMEEDVNKAREDGYREGVESEQNEPAQEVGALLGFTSDGYRVAIVDADPSSDVELDDEGKVVCNVDPGLTVRLDVQILETERIGGEHLYDILTHGNYTTPSGETVSIAGTYNAKELCDEVLDELSNPQDSNEDGELQELLENASGLYFLNFTTPHLIAIIPSRLII